LLARDSLLAVGDLPGRVPGPLPRKLLRSWREGDSADPSGRRPVLGLRGRVPPRGAGWGPGAWWTDRALRSTIAPALEATGPSHRHPPRL